MAAGADRGIALVGGLVRSRTACPGRRMGRIDTCTVASRRVHTGSLRIPAGEIRTMAILATRKAIFRDRPLCPFAMNIRVRPVGDIMLAGVRIY